MHFRKTILSVSVSVTIGYIDYAFGRNDNISIGIGYNRLYRLGTGQQSVISIMRLGETILSVSVSVIIGYIDYAFGGNDIIGIGIGYNRLYRLGSGQQSVISIMLGPTIVIID
jgi:hypothetical protein